MHNKVSKKMKKTKSRKSNHTKILWNDKNKILVKLLIFYFQILSNDIILVYPVLY